MTQSMFVRSFPNTLKFSLNISMLDALLRLSLRVQLVVEISSAQGYGIPNSDIIKVIALVSLDTKWPYGFLIMRLKGTNSLCENA